ncbi:uncharacterized protein EKO05_0000678 [Ascochyta rabiei]|uniref:Uncharacterized protein n=1 Tax=Didymella rabiei TaxID=5454 RepID=A0A162VVW1_DIDRA|nr:uncharacterized protein EKO05_0000678 [Ascochyta rabiei]KZM18636.1 hypothetical protein ST47_g10243 [Ascochyta rabiei]UPX10002.1 hypothetical protein EKO05_0000678 [Ascochyta rabiei]
MQPFRTNKVSTISGDPQSIINTNQDSSDEGHQNGNMQFNRTTYPNAGAFQHLPVRRTLSGAPAQEHPNAYTIFLRDLPAHCYILPPVPLNFTMVELIVLLPNWFKNKSVVTRFMNNNLTAAIHFMILEEHRYLQFPTGKEKEKARKTIADEYRRAMRKMIPSWTKVGHTVPFGWDPNSLAMDGFVPDDVEMPGYRRPASIPFRDLTMGVQKIPEGPHAGDLTSALQFALQRPEIYMFPEDLPVILNHIGPTKITIAHTDRAIVRHYDEIKREGDHAKKYPSRHNGLRPTAEELVARLSPHETFEREKMHTVVQALRQGGRPAATESPEVYDPPFMFQRSGFNVAGMLPRNQKSVVLAQTQPNLAHEVDELFRLPAQVETDAVAYQTVEKSPIVGVERSSEATMDALLRPYQGTHDSRTLKLTAGRPYAPSQLLRHCVEGNIGFDGSFFAQAARYAQRLDQIGTHWCVEHVPWLAQILSAAQLEDRVDL